MIILNSFRGYAALAVFFAHFNQVFIYPFLGLNSKLVAINGIVASMAVVIFFIISGYVIAHSLKSNYARNTMNEFVINRIARIYPPLLLAIVLTLVIYVIISSFELHGYKSYRLVDDLYVVRARAIFNLQNFSSALMSLQGVFPNPLTLISGGGAWLLTYQ